MIIPPKKEPFIYDMGYILLNWKQIKLNLSVLFEKSPVFFYENKNWVDYV